MALARSLQLLAARAACLAPAAASGMSSAAAGSAALGALGASAAAAAASPAAAHRAAAVAGGLRQLVRHFHASLQLREEGGAPTINPLQQAPTPASPMGAPAPFPGLGGEEGLPTTSRAVHRDIAISPQKLNDFAKVVRGLHLDDALLQCKISPKKAAAIVEKALLSARANAETNRGLDSSRLRVAEAWVGKGVHLKRISIHGRGRSSRRLRYRSHLTVVLREEEEEPRRRTRIMPQLMERQKWLRMREDQQRRRQAAAA